LLPHVQSSVSPSHQSLANSFQENGEMVRFNENSLKLSILIPVFNESQTIAAVVERVQAVPIDQEIVLVDDASSGGTAGIVERLASSRVWVLHHAASHGKGAAIRTALAAATFPPLYRGTKLQSRKHLTL
jgi:cellulose synthase/poly-beta-1,6-N-acetylglucosamine synthase-like glycosyltransferase